MVGLAGSSDVEGRSVVDGNAIDRQTQRHVHGGVEGDELDRDMALVVVLREKMEGLEVRNQGKRKAALSLELSADKDSYLQDMRPGGTNLDFAQFRL